MLDFLSIKNFAVIDSIELAFGKSINIITGETGAGKTIIVEALKALLGSRITRDDYKDINKPIVIEGIFSNVDKLINENIKEVFSIDDYLIIRREAFYNSKNKIYINNRFATLKDVKNTAQNIIEISTQFENQRLTDKKYHLSYIDSFIQKEYLNNYIEKFKEYNNLKNNLNRLLKEKKINEEKKSLLLFKKKELSNAKLNLDEDLYLDNKIKYLSNIEKLTDSLTSAINYLNQGDINLNYLLNKLIRELEYIKEFYSDIDIYFKKIEELGSYFDELSKELEEKLGYNETSKISDLNRLVERKFYLDSLMNKYKTDLKGLVLLMNEIEEELQNITENDSKIIELEKKLKIKEGELKKASFYLNEKRKEIAQRLEDMIVKALGDVGLNNAIFKVKFNELEEYIPTGSIEAEFNISINPGFPPAGLRKIASGGELARIVLVLKEIFATSENINTIIFDEIDTGISGITAKMVANKLAKIAEKRQLILITHLPVIAAKGDTHYHIVKETDSNKASIRIVRLDDAGRREILATMISGNVTDSSLNQANELLRDKS
ncbi:MAG: hypothetical protein SVN78_07765 [Deferribacterota bacterium]|nr:hypothetical protein [Deferribacterota bacterium]